MSHSAVSEAELDALVASLDDEGGAGATDVHAGPQRAPGSKPEAPASRRARESAPEATAWRPAPASEPEALASRPEALASRPEAPGPRTTRTAPASRSEESWQAPGSGPPPRAVLGRYFRGVVLVPERHLFVGRLEDRVAAAIQLQEPPRNNEAQAHSATLTTLFVAPWARGHGIGPRLIQAVEDRAGELGYLRLNFDVRATQVDAVRLFESLGFEPWGTNPAYALVDGDLIPGHYYSKQLRTLPKKKKRKGGKKTSK